MFSLLPLLALTVGGTVAEAAADAAYPAREVLAAFATACSGVEDTAVNLASIEAAGWERLSVDADAPVSQLVRAGMKALADAARADGSEVPEVIPGGEFRCTVAERELYLAVSGTGQDGIEARGCRLYDFAATQSIGSETLEDWAVRAPSQLQTLPDGSIKATFHPGLKPGHMELELFFIPPSAAPVAGISVSGISLVATAIKL